MSGLTPAGALWHPSPNFGPRRGAALPDLVVIHYTAMADADAALQRLCDPAAEVSAHYLIGGDGTLWHLVEEKMRAWHAGAGRWGAVGDVNSRSIGIELDNRGDHPFAAAQMARLEQLLADVLTRWRIPPARVIGHSDMAPARKSDPGARFDWARLARAGLAVGVRAAAWAEDAGAAEAPRWEAFRAACGKFGYPTDSAIGNEALLTAVRARFRPGQRGGLNAQDLAMMRDLADRFPVDLPAPSA